ncbi:hypothetical protein [Nocardioides sp. BYT-33-1]|jgi:hypothetical protein|uniref:hypothetical protein n=1 Tax=Nocardioides sp. BYT-33-1 TaxID=3416952 RepID=UPI003F5397DA
MNPNLHARRVRRSLTAVGSSLAALLLVGATAGAAHAAPALSLSDTTIDISDDIPNGTISVTGTDFGAYDEADLYVGVCTVRNIGLYNIPACGWFERGADGEVTVDGSGNLAATLELTEHPIVNSHAGIPLSGQPATINCLTEQTSHQGCRVVVVDHSGFTSSFVANAAVTFQA